jgi:hypothetical protein
MLQKFLRTAKNTNHDSDFFDRVALAAAGTRNHVPNSDGSVSHSNQADDPLEECCF